MSGMKVAKARKSLPTSNRKQLASLHRTSNVVGQPDCADRIFLLTAEVLEYGSDIDGSLENTSSSEILKIDGSEPDVLLCRITSIQGQVMDSENSDTQFGNEAEDVLLYKVTSVQSRQDAMEKVLDEDNAQTSIKEQMCSPENTLIRENGCSFQEDFGMGIEMMSNETHNGSYQSAESSIICTMVDSIDSSLEGHCEVSILDDTQFLEQKTMTQNTKNPTICIVDPLHFMDPSSSNRNGDSYIQKALEENPLLKPFLSQSKDERSTGLIKKVPTKCGCGTESPTLRNLLQNDRGLNLESQLQHACHNVKNAKCDHKYDDANVQEVHIYDSKIPEMLSDASKAPAIQTDASVLKMQTDRCETLKIRTSDSEATQMQTGGSEAPKMRTGVTEVPKIQTGVTEAPKMQANGSVAPKMQANGSVAPKKRTDGSEAPKTWTASSEAMKKWTAGSEAPKKRRDGSEALAKLPDGSEVPAKLPDGSEAPEKQTGGSEVPHNGTSGSGEPHEGTSISWAPHGGSGAPNEGTGSSGAPHHGTGGSRAPHDGTSSSRAPHNGTGGSGAPHDGTGGSGAPHDGTGSSGAPHDGTGGSGAPHDGTGGSGSPHNGTGGSGSPHDGTSGSGSPHDGTGGSGEPHDGTGGSGEPHDGTGGSGAPHDGTGGSGAPHDGTSGPEAPQEGTSGPKASQKRTGDSEALKMLTDSSEAYKLVTDAPEEPKILTHCSEAQMLTDGSEALAVSISGTTALEMQPVNVKATWILLGDASTQDLQPSQLGDTNVQQDRLDYNAMQLIESSPHGMQPECMDFNVEHKLNESILPLKRQMSREPICDESEDYEQNKSKRIRISSIEHNSPMEGGEQQLTSIEKVIRAIFEKNFGSISPHIVIEEIQKINGQLENKNQKLAKYEKLTNIVQDKLKCAERKVVTVLQTLKKRKRMLQNAQVPQMTSMPLLAQVTSMVQGVAIPSSSSPAHRRLDNAQDMQMQNSSAGPPVQPMNMTSSGQNASGRLRTAIPPRQSPMSVQTSPQLGGFRYAPGTSNIPNRTQSDPAVKVSTHNYVDNQTGVSIAVLPNRVDGLISGTTTVPRRWRNQADAMTQEKLVSPSQMASKPPERQSNQKSSTMTVRDMISMVRSSSETVTEGAVSHPRPTLSLAPPIPTALSSSTNDHAAIPQHPAQTGPPHTRPMEGPIVIDDEPNNVRAPPTSTRSTSWTRPNTDGSFQPTQGATTPGAFSSPALRLVSTRGSVSQGVPGRGSGITSIQPSTGTFADSSVPTGRPGTFRSAGSTTENRNHVNEVVDGGPVPPRSLPAGSLRSPNTQHPPSSKEMPSAAPVVQEIAPSTDAVIDLTLDEDRMHQGNAARRAPTARNQLPAPSRGHPPLLPHGSQVSPNRGPVSSTQGVRSVQLASGGSHLPPPVPAHPPPPPQPVHLAPAPPPPPSLVESDVISTLRTTRFPNVISNVRMPRVSQPSNAARITQPSSVFPLTRGPPALLNVTNSAQLRPMMTHSVSVVSVPSTNSTSPRNIPEFSSRPAQSNISSYRRIAPSQSVVCPKQMSLGSNNFVRPNFQPAMPRHPPPSYMGVSQTVTGLAPATHGASLIDTLPVRMQYDQRGSSTQTAGMRGSAQPSGPVVPPSSQHMLQMVGGRDVAASYALPFPNSRFGSFPGPGISQSSTTGIPQSVATVRQHPVTQQVDPALIPLQIANTQTSLAAGVTFTNTSTISAGCNRTVVPSQPTLNPSAQTSLTASGMALRTGQNVPNTVPHSNHVLPPPTYAGSTSQMGPPPATCGPPPAQAPPSEASIRHPPPLPNTPPLSVPIPHEAMGTLPPPRPLLKLGRADNQGAIVLQWSVAEPVQESTTPHRAPAESYHIYAYHEDIQQGAATQWKKIGDVQALPLPMACTLTQFMVGSRYYFTVRAKDAFGRFSPFCEPQCADLKA